jgi:hypothetical protein
MIAGEKTVPTFPRRKQYYFGITLQALGKALSETTAPIQADATYRLGALDEPITHYGVFVLPSRVRPGRITLPVKMQR